MSRLAVSTLVLMLAGCSLSPERLAEADALVAAHRGSIELVPEPEPRYQRSALDRIALEAHEHHLLVVEQGTDALAMRIHLIRSASERIELMNYIFYNDEAGHLLLTELVDAARRGVAVRILVDSLFSLDDPKLLAAMELLDADIQIRVYNPPFDRLMPGNLALAAAVVCCFRQLNDRLHHKLLAIDGRHALIGGRNIADRYFDLDTRMNFLDLEVLVSGAVVANMADDFQRFWEHAGSRPARHTREVVRLLKHDRPEILSLDRHNRASYASAMIEESQWLEALIAGAGHRVGEVAYFSDPPEKVRRLDEAVSTRVLHDLIAGARHRVLIQTPYFVLSPDFERVLAGVSDGVEIIVSSNSLAATDAWPVYAISRKQRYLMVHHLGVRLHEIKPFPADLHVFYPRYEQLVVERAMGFESPMRVDPPPAIRERPGPRASLHAKVMVIDDEIAVVTSHNFDPRSERFSTENGIVVRDREFARALTRYIERIAAPGNSWLVAPRPQGPPVIGPINRFMAQFSRSLPTLDLWPWYLTENYRIDDQADVIDPADPEFHDDHEAVGVMPEVVLLRRIFSTGLVSRMFGFLRPLM